MNEYEKGKLQQDNFLDKYISIYYENPEFRIT